MTFLSLEGARAVKGCCFIVYRMDVSLALTLLRECFLHNLRSVIVEKNVRFTLENGRRF